MGSRINSYYSEDGKAVYTGKGLTASRNLQRKHRPALVADIACKPLLSVIANGVRPDAEARLVEEPDAEKLQVRIWAGEAE